MIERYAGVVMRDHTPQYQDDCGTYQVEPGEQPEIMTDERRDSSAIANGTPRRPDGGARQITKYDRKAPATVCPFRKA
jgi:hypothetical protein